ncbi:hypothetical protein WJX81_007301 [Elliptochloris bilobata]|uniref:Uncharacterized protein n=1 Tax=Elliptochloris bilobata TaxID=381761 RepID=A0AAW1SIS7_9CHLO
MVKPEPTAEDDTWPAGRWGSEYASSSSGDSDSAAAEEEELADAAEPTNTSSASQSMRRRTHRPAARAATLTARAVPRAGDTRAHLARYLAALEQRYGDVSRPASSATRLSPPAGSAADANPDARVPEALAHVAELDGALAAAAAAADAAARDACPERWAARQRRRAASRQAALQRAIAGERRRQVRAARLQRALDLLAGGAPDGGTAERPACGLGPEQPCAALDAVMAMGDDELDADPFSCDAIAVAAGGAPCVGPGLSLVDLDARLSDFAAEHTWDAGGSLCDFGALGMTISVAPLQGRIFFT